MDGNGRWASAKGMPRNFGHAAGAKKIMEIVRACPVVGITKVTIFAFAIANWKREKVEVDGLWNLLHSMFMKDIAELIHEGARVSVIGNKEGLPQKVRAEVEKAEEDSLHNTKFLLQVALNYDGVDEVARMIKKIIDTGVPSSNITTEYIQSHLDTEAGDNPDILIRTGMPATAAGLGIWRSSAFLPIQSVQSVCVSTDVLWPDFTIEHLQKIIIYASPEKRLFGGQRK